MHRRPSTLRLAVGAAALGVTAVTTGALVSPASAAPSWGTLATLDGGRLQACKASVDADTWRLRMRVNAKHADNRIKGTVVADKPGTDKTWRSGWVARGTVSATGSFTVPKGAGWTLRYSVGADGYGGGGDTTIGQITRC